MSVSVPKAFTLAISVNDLINYKGQNYVISAVAAGVDDGVGGVTYVLTLTGAPVSTITVGYKNCVAQSLQGAYGNTVEPTTWYQSANP
jgi:hypothetical protein